MPLGLIAFDASVRSYDKDGRLHISRTPISKATVNPYYGREIPDSEALGLDPNRIYQLLRDPQELAKAAPSFARNQILAKHIPVSAEDCQREVIAGAIGSEVEFVEPYLWADVSIWDDTAIAGIETNTVREFSAAYHYKPDMTPGVYQGTPYDGVMREIHGNHLALVESGRAGSDVLAADEAIKTMKTTKLGKALIVTLGGMSPKLAQDSALPALVGQAAKKTLNPADLSSKLIAMDADLDPAKLTSTLDALLALDADDDDDDEKRKKKMAEDDDDDDDEKDDDDEETKERKRKRRESRQVAQDAKLQLAMDSFKSELRAADEARRAVRPVVGEVIAQDTAAEIYGFALDHMQIKHEGITDPKALQALFDLANSQKATAPTARIAHDSAGLATKFPAVARFRTV